MVNSKVLGTAGDTVLIFEGTKTNGKILDKNREIVMEYKRDYVEARKVHGLTMGYKLMGVSFGISLTDDSKNRYEIITHYPEYRNDFIVEKRGQSWVFKNRNGKYIFEIDNYKNIMVRGTRGGAMNRGKKFTRGKVEGNISPLILIALYIYTYGYFYFKDRDYYAGS